MSTWTHERARVASLTRSRKPDDPELITARRNLRAARLEDYIKKTVDAAPKLTLEQRDRLATLLRGGEPPGDRVAGPSPLAEQTEGRKQQDSYASGGGLDAA